MRFYLLARHMILVPALGLALAPMVAACASSTSSSVSPTHSPTSAPPSVSASALITTNWETFFNGETAAAKRVALLQNGQAFASIIQAQSSSSLAESASAKVLKVVVTSPTQATVTYNVLLSGTTALSNQTGTSVYQTGTWKVSDVSFCGLLALEGGGKAPSVCSSAGG